jgi:hypothetical protein
MRSLICYFSFLLLIFGAACKSHKTVAVVILDASNSITSNRKTGDTITKTKRSQPITSLQGGMIKMFNDLQEVTAKLCSPYKNTSIYFLAISGILNDSLLSATPYHVEAVNINDKAYQKACNDSILAVVKKNLIVRSNYTWEKTCILTTLQHAMNLVHEKEIINEGDSLQIIILSDMVEECDNSIAGRIGFTRLADDKRIDSLNTQIDTMQVVFTLTDPQLKICAIDVARGANPVEHQRLETLWKKIFNKLGYSNFKFLYDVPGKL